MKYNQRKIGVVLSYITLFLSTGISIIYTPIMHSILGQSEYGLYQLVASAVSYLSLLTLGFGGAYTRFYTRYKVKNQKEEINELNGMFLTFYLVVGFIALVCGWYMSTEVSTIFQSLSPEELHTASILMKTLTVNIAMSFPFSVFNAYVTVHEEYFFQRVLSFIKTIVNPFVTLPVLLLGYQSVGLVVVTTILNLTMEISLAIFAVKKLQIKFSLQKFDLTLFREIAVFSIFIFMNIIIEQVNYKVDDLLLGYFSGTTAVAIYSIAMQLKTYYFTFSTTIASVFIPKITEISIKDSSENELTQLFTRIGRLQFLVLSLILSGFIFFGQPFLSLWLGEEYLEAYWIFLLIGIPATVPMIQNIGITIQQAMNLHQFRSIVYLLIAVGNVMISIPLCQVYGGIGCAIGTAISLVLGNGIAMNTYYQIKIRLDMLYFWKEIFSLSKGFLLPLISGFYFFHMNQYYYSVYRLICGILLYSLLFSGSMWFFGMNTYEKGNFTRILKRLRKIG